MASKTQDVRDCMNFIVEQVVRRSCIESAILEDALDRKKGCIVSENKPCGVIQQTNKNTTKTKQKKRKCSAKKDGKKKKRTKKELSGPFAEEKGAILDQEDICRDTDERAKALDSELKDSKKALDDCRRKKLQLENESKESKKKALELEELVLSLPDPKPPKQERKPINFPQAQIVPPSTALKDLQGPNHLISSALPPLFPPELSFRALSLYAIIRSMSLRLHLSPFTPISFLRALTFPCANRLLSEVHLVILRQLFAHKRFGSYDKRGNFRKDLSTKNLRGGHNLNYMNAFTWTLFYEDYVEVTLEHLLQSETIHSSLNRNEEKLDSTISFHSEASNNKKIKLNTDILQNAKDLYDAEEMDEEESDAEEYLEPQICIDSNEVATHRQRGAKTLAAKKLKEAKNEDDTLSASDGETTDSEEYKIKSTEAKNMKHQSSAQLQNKMSTSPLNENMLRENSQSGPVGMKVNPGTINQVTNRDHKTQREHLRALKAKDTVKEKESPCKSNISSRKTRGRPRKSNSLNRLKRDEVTLAKKKKSISAKTQDHVTNDYAREHLSSETLAKQSFSVSEKRGLVRPSQSAQCAEKMSTEASSAIDFFFSIPPNKPFMKHSDPKVQALLSVIKDISHVDAARILRHGKSYPSLPILTKIEILEFLVDELLVTTPISLEMQHRERITSCFPGKFGFLPSQSELQNLSNADECVVCGIEGDLICCDGCTSSFHCKCINLPSGDSLPEGIWLCAECKIVDPAKFGPLNGGSKCCIDWFTVSDFLSVVFPLKTRGGLHAPVEAANVEENQTLNETTTVCDVNISSSSHISNPISDTKKPVTLETNSLENKASLDSKNETWENKATLHENGSVINNEKHMHNSRLRPNLRLLENKEFILIHGFVFERSTGSLPVLSPIPLSPDQVWDLLLSLGPEYSMKWPWCQIPFNPFEVWEDVPEQSSEALSILFKDKKQKFSNYCMAPESFNPTLYQNIYRKSPLPKHIYFFTKAETLPTCPSMNEEVLNFHTMNCLSMDLGHDKTVIQKMLLDQSLYDPLRSCKDYLIKLERTLSKACLLHEFWGVNKKIILHLWTEKILRCTSVSKLTKLCLELIDAIHLRAFHEDWFKNLAQGRLKQNSNLCRKYYDLCDGWTPAKESLRRKWEKGSYIDCLNLLQKEGNRIGGWVSGMAGRKKRKVIKFSLGCSAKSNDPQNVLETLLMGTPEGNVDAKQQVHNELSGIPHAITGRDRKKTEGAKNPPFILGSSLVSDAKMLTPGVVKMNREVKEKSNFEERNNAVKKMDKGTTKKVGKKKDANNGKVLSRRRSERYQSRAPTIQSKIVSIINGAPSGIVYDCSNDDKTKHTIDSEITKERNTKVASLERLVNESHEKQAHWRLCGRYFFPPVGSLPLPVLRRIGRNAGMKHAPYILYSSKFEVGQPSISHCWRKLTSSCKSIEDFNLQLCILESFLNRSVIHSCELTARRVSVSKNTSNKVIRCTHFDSALGMLEHFVVNVAKNRGIWLPDDSVDLSALILERYNRIEKHRKSFSQKLLEKKKKEEEEKNREILKIDSIHALERLRVDISTLQNAIVSTDADIKTKETKMQKIEDAYALVRLNVEKENEKLMHLTKVYDMAIEEAKMAEVARKSREAAEKKAKIEDKAAKLAAIKAAKKKQPIQRAVEKPEVCRDRDRGRGKGSGNETLFPTSNSRESASRSGNTESCEEENEDDDIWMIADSTSDYLRLESKYIAEFHNAKSAHIEATKRLLRKSAERNLNTVPVEEMNKERVNNMRKMQDVIDKLENIGSTIRLEKQGITQAITDAESQGIELYRKDAERRTFEHKQNDVMCNSSHPNDLFNKKCDDHRENDSHQFVLTRNDNLRNEMISNHSSYASVNNKSYQDQAENFFLQNISDAKHSNYMDPISNKRTGMLKTSDQPNINDVSYNLMVGNNSNFFTNQDQNDFALLSSALASSDSRCKQSRNPLSTHLHYEDAHDHRMITNMNSSLYAITQDQEGKTKNDQGDSTNSLVEISRFGQSNEQYNVRDQKKIMGSNKFKNDTLEDSCYQQSNNDALGPMRNQPTMLQQERNLFAQSLQSQHLGGQFFHVNEALPQSSSQSLFSFEQLQAAKNPTHYSPENMYMQRALQQHQEHQTMGIASSFPQQSQFPFGMTQMQHHATSLPSSSRSTSLRNSFDPSELNLWNIK